MKPDYTALDAAILERISRGDTPTFTSIDASPNVAAATQALASAYNAGRPSSKHKPEFRFTDSRLQALRRAGKIRYTGSGWALA